MMQSSLSCANCHGSEGHGGNVQFMMQSFDVPNITWPALTGPDPDMQHPPYTEETLKRAITQGIDPGGSPLEYPMPSWQMSAGDLNDLVSYIKTLK
jgi:cytochrome c oxidase subunit 2